MTKEKYSKKLEESLNKLVERLKRKSYKPQPARRVEIEKGNGKTRPLSIYCYEDKLVQEAVVVGGGNTAMDGTLHLSDTYNKVYLVHCRSEFRGSAKTLERIRQKDNIEIVTEAKIAKIAGDAAVNEVTLEDGRTFKVEGFFAAGDVKKKALRQIGANAAVSAAEWLSHK